MKLFVFDVGGTEIKFSVINEKLNMSDAGFIRTPQYDGDTKDEAALDKAYDEFLTLLRDVFLPHKEEVMGIALSLPGFIDVKNGRQCGGGALPYIMRRNIAEDLSKRCDLPVVMANDAKCATVAEQKSGSLMGCENAGVFIIGTGAGGGLIIHGKILNGAHFTAGEYSLLRVSPEGDWADRLNTVGDVCSTRGLLLAYKSKVGLDKDAPLDGREFFARYEKGEVAAIEAFDEFCYNMAFEIQNMTFLMDLEKVAIGGGISKRPELIVGIQKQIDRLDKNAGEVYDVNMPKAQVVPCKYSSEANQIGAYYTFCEEMK